MRDPTGKYASMRFRRWVGRVHTWGRDDAIHGVHSEGMCRRWRWRWRWRKQTSWRNRQAQTCRAAPRRRRRGESAIPRLRLPHRHRRAAAINHQSAVKPHMDCAFCLMRSRPPAAQPVHARGASTNHSSPPPLPCLISSIPFVFPLLSLICRQSLRLPTLPPPSIVLVAWARASSPCPLSPAHLAPPSTLRPATLARPGLV